MWKIEHFVKDIAKKYNLPYEEVKNVSEYMETYIKIGSPYGRSAEGFFKWWMEKPFPRPND